MISEEVLAENRRVGAEAIERIGGCAETARMLSTEDSPVSLGVVWAWINRDKRGIPIDYLEQIENLSGIRRELIRQDIPWRPVNPEVIK